MKKALIRFVTSLLAAILALGALTGAALAATVYASGGDSYIRSQPNLSGTQIATLHDGESATYLDQSSVDPRGVNWYYVSYKGKTGWVSSTYTSLSGAYDDYDSYEDTIYASGGDTYIRSQPSISGAQLALFPEGASATYMGSSSVDSRGVKWYRVSYRGTYGWVSSRYTSFSSDYGYGYNYGNSGAGDEIYAEGGDSYIRSQPSLSGSQIALFPEGAVATYLFRSAVDERGVTWYRISYRGNTGWVSSKYTSLSDDYEDTVYASGGDSYIRSQPNLSGAQLGLFPDGAAASYLGDSSVDSRGVTWFHISYNGKTGWVSSKYSHLN